MVTHSPPTSEALPTHLGVQTHFMHSPPPTNPSRSSTSQTLDTVRTFTPTFH